MKKTILFGALALMALMVSFTSCSKYDEATTPVEDTNIDTSQTTLTAEQTALITALRSKYADGVIDLVITSAEADSPYKKDDALKLTLASTGKLTIEKSGSMAKSAGKTTNEKSGSMVEIATFEKVGNEYIWKDIANDLQYALSLKPDTTNEINEVNISKITDNKFLAQAEPKNEPTTENGSTSTFSLTTKGWNYSSAIAPTIIDIPNFYTSAGVAGVNQDNKSGQIQCFFPSGGLKAGTYQIDPPIQVGTSSTFDVTKIGAGKVHVLVLSYEGTTTSPKEVKHYGQSGEAVVTIVDGNVKIALTNIPAKAYGSADDTITALIQGTVK